jgi:hypothetical protein
VAFERTRPRLGIGNDSSSYKKWCSIYSQSISKQAKCGCCYCLDDVHNAMAICAFMFETGNAKVARLSERKFTQRQVKGA